MTSERPELQDFPALDRWGDELRDATKRKEGRSARFRLPIRRVAVAVAVMLLAVPGAIATRSIWTDPIGIEGVDPRLDSGSTPPVALAEGDAGAVHWQLGAFDQRDGTRCVQLRTTAATTSQVFGGCTQPLGGPAQLTVGASTKEGVGFYYGAVTASAARVRVTVPGGRTAVANTIQPDAESLRRAGLSEQRVWIATFPGGVDVTAGTPVVVVLDDDGREIARVPEPERTP